MPNVPTGTYKNHVGAELDVTGIACRTTTEYGTLNGDIALAEAPVGGGRYLVTEASLAEAGYTLLT